MSNACGQEGTLLASVLEIGPRWSSTCVPWSSSSARVSPPLVQLPGSCQPFQYLLGFSSTCRFTRQEWSGGGWSPDLVWLQRRMSKVCFRGCLHFRSIFLVSSLVTLTYRPHLLCSLLFTQCDQSLWMTLGLLLFICTLIGDHTCSLSRLCGCLWGWETPRQGASGCQL